MTIRFFLSRFAFPLNECRDTYFEVQIRPAQVGDVLQPGARTVGEKNRPNPIVIGRDEQPGNLFGLKGLFDDRLMLKGIGGADRVVTNLAKLARLLERSIKILPSDFRHRARRPATLE